MQEGMRDKDMKIIFPDRIEVPSFTHVTDTSWDIQEFEHPVSLLAFR
jgi:hypothetical protein